MVDWETRYVHAPDVLAREIAGEVILVPIRESVGDLEQIYTLNETAAWIWGLLDGTRTLAEVHEAMVAEFEVEDEQAGTDLLALVEELSELGVIRTA